MEISDDIKKISSTQKFFFFQTLSILEFRSQLSVDLNITPVIEFQARLEDE